MEGGGGVQGKTTSFSAIFALHQIIRKFVDSCYLTFLEKKTVRGHFLIQGISEKIVAVYIF